MANTYLKRTNGTPTNAQKGTWSAWVKRSTVDASHRIVMNFADGNNYSYFRINSANYLQLYGLVNGSEYCHLKTNALFRDTSAWYHIVITIDTTQSTTADRIKLYVNGEQITSWLEYTGASQNTNHPLLIASGTNYHTVGSAENGTEPWNGSMSYVHLIDGTAYDATAFGEYDANGVWTIKTSPSVTYGTNGYFILKDGNSVTDQSPNTNNFTVGGGTLTKTEDSPSNVFATMNPLDQTNVGGSSATMTNGNLTWQSSSNNTSQSAMRGTLGLTQGKWYWEVKYISASGSEGFSIGICGSEANLNVGASGDILEGANPNVMWLNRASNSSVKKNSSDVTTGLTDANIGDIMMLAVDMDNLKFFVGINGTWLNSANPVTGANAPSTIDANTYLPAISNYGYSNLNVLSCNFGNGYFGTTAVASAGTNASGIGIFEYDVPTGYTALSTKGLNL